MHSGADMPLVASNALMREALFTITAKGLGITGVTDADGAMIGVITDGDLRRALEKGIDILNSSAGELMTARAEADQPAGAGRPRPAADGAVFHHLAVCL